eukprot:scaffold55524_cov41-Tisochrysis_lutea.AAC.3
MSVFCGRTPTHACKLVSPPSLVGCAQILSWPIDGCWHEEHVYMARRLPALSPTFNRRVSKGSLAHEGAKPSDTLLGNVSLRVSQVLLPA